MPTWGEILKELQESAQGGSPPKIDEIRRKYSCALSAYTKRAAILYATKWTQPDPGVSPELISILDEDLQGLMEVIHGIKNADLDLILHSPGGSLEAAEALVLYLRTKFNHIRVVVPQQAMSAATMIACAADEIVLGKHSFLGPIDPQFILNTPLGPRMVPAQAILDQFEQAKKECEDPARLGAWIPMLSQYGPDLLVKCENASDMSRTLVQGWLEAYMFKDDRNRRQKARKIARWLSDHRYFKSHGRHIARSDLEENGLKIRHLESVQQLQDLVLSVFHATTHTFNLTSAVKILENQHGRAFIKQAHAQRVIVPVPAGLPQLIPPSP